MKRLFLLALMFLALFLNPFTKTAALKSTEPQTVNWKNWPARIVHQASGIVLILIPAGEFPMGSPLSEPDRATNERQHRRIVRQPFYIGEAEVTVEQFRKFVKSTQYLTDAERGVNEDEHSKGAFASTPDGDRQWSDAASWKDPFPNLKQYHLNDNHPVVQVSWTDAEKFVEHYGLQLTSEAQWEYATRAGSRSRYFWGDTEAEGKGYGNVADAEANKHFPRWNLLFPFDDGVWLLSEVGKYKPNAWKLRDMVGNVSEWCEDAYVKDYPADGADEAAVKGDDNSARVVRGGSWLDAPDTQRSAKRIALAPHSRRDFVGFRVAMKIGG